jgi:predicted dehydrogenase
VLVGIRGHGVGERLHASIWRAFEGVIVKHIPRELELASIERFDLAVIAVPPKHQLLALDSLSSRSDLILCEKPCGLDLSDLSAWIARTPSLVQNKVFINYQLRFLPGSLLLQLREGVQRAGTISIVYKSSARIVQFEPGEWKAQAKSGGGVVVSILSHLVDLLHFLGAKQIDFSEIDVVAKSGSCPNEVFDGIKLMGELVLRDEHRLEIEIDTVSESEIFEINFGSGANRSIDLLSEDADGLDHRRGRLRSDSQGPWRSSYMKLAKAISSAVFNRQVGPEVIAKPMDALWVQTVLARVRALSCPQVNSSGIIVGPGPHDQGSN